MRNSLAVSYSPKQVTIFYPATLLPELAQDKQNQISLKKKKKKKTYTRNATDTLLRVAKTGGKMTIKRKMDFKSAVEQSDGTLLRLQRSNTYNDMDGTQKHA